MGRPRLNVVPERLHDALHRTVACVRDRRRVRCVPCSGGRRPTVPRRAERRRTDGGIMANTEGFRVHVDDRPPLPLPRELEARARAVAASRACVLLLGERGTGKTVLARRIHEWSARSQGPFVTVDLASTSVELIHSELFGHTRGAFTGAGEAREDPPRRPRHFLPGRDLGPSAGNAGEPSHALSGGTGPARGFGPLGHRRRASGLCYEPGPAR